MGGHDRYLLVCIAPVVVCDDLRTPAELATSRCRKLFSEPTPQWRVAPLWLLVRLVFSKYQFHKRKEHNSAAHGLLRRERSFFKIARLMGAEHHRLSSSVAAAMTRAASSAPSYAPSFPARLKTIWDDQGAEGKKLVCNPAQG